MCNQAEEKRRGFFLITWHRHVFHCDTFSRGWGGFRTMRNKLSNKKANLERELQFGQFPCLAPWINNDRNMQIIRIHVLFKISRSTSISSLKRNLCRGIIMDKWELYFYSNLKHQSFINLSKGVCSCSVWLGAQKENKTLYFCLNQHSLYHYHIHMSLLRPVLVVLGLILYWVLIVLSWMMMTLVFVMVGSSNAGRVGW